MTTETSPILTGTENCTPLTRFFDEINSRIGGNLPPVDGQTSLDEYQMARADILNAMPGSLDGADCPKCRNKGILYTVRDGEIMACDCECMPQRQSVWAMKYSGLGDLLKCGFDNFYVSEPWQDTALKRARFNAESDGGEWLYAGGQNGSGKTHLCTAVCKRLMERGFKVRYVLWGEVYRRLQALKFKDEEYEKYIGELKAAEVLYIDDFLKAGRGGGNAGRPPESEITAAYGIINMRSLARNTRRRTIISAEYLLPELNDIDTATAGRIKQKCGGYLIQIERHAGRDYRQKR